MCEPEVWRHHRYRAPHFTQCHQLNTRQTDVGHEVNKGASGAIWAIFWFLFETKPKCHVNLENKTYRTNYPHPPPSVNYTGSRGIVRGYRLVSRVLKWHSVDEFCSQTQIMCCKLRFGLVRELLKHYQLPTDRFCFRASWLHKIWAFATFFPLMSLRSEVHFIKTENTLFSYH